MRVPLRFLALPLPLLALPLAAQTPRTPQVVDGAPSNQVAHPAVGASGGLAAFAWVDDSTAEVYVATSSDHGLTWSAPVLVGASGGNKTLEPWSVHVVGDRIWVGWDDGSDCRLNRFESGAWQGEQAIPKGTPTGTGMVADWRLAVAEGGTDVHVVFAMAVDPTGATNEELRVAASQDGGATFGAATHVPTPVPGLFDVDDLALALDGDEAYVAWVDNRSSFNDLFLQKSDDGGATWAGFVTELQVNAPFVPPGDVQFGVDLDAAGGTVALAWAEERPDTGNEQLRARVSTDGGATFGPDELVGNYTPVTHDVDFPAVHVAAGAVVALWEDNRAGPDEVYASRTTDGGVTWEPDVQLSTQGGGFPRVAGSGANVVVTFSSGDFPNRAESAWSLDAGATFTTLTSAVNTGDVDFAEQAYDALAENVVLGWLADDLGGNDAYAGGFSICGPATVTNRIAGTNVQSFTASSPVLGTTFQMAVDASLSGHQNAAIYALKGPANIVLEGERVLLIDPGTPFLFLLTGAGPQVSLSMNVPNDPRFCGFTLSAQAFHFGGAPGVAFSNAQDIETGAF